MRQFREIFSQVDDPRSANARHDFMTVLFIALFAVLCGAESCSDMADFGASKRKLLLRVVKLPHGAPSHDTFSRVFRHIDPGQFAQAFASFARGFAGRLKGVVAIDGKAVRHAFERGFKTAPLHLVNVWAAEARMVIGQMTAPGRNEVKGALEVLKLLSLDGCTVTADALHCRADTAEAILKTGAGYALALKKNQPKLFAQAEALFASGETPETAEAALPASHDRGEIRRAAVLPAEGVRFPGIAAIARVETIRIMPQGPTPSIVRYFVLSAKVSAARMIEIAQTHWTIENQLHWVLDVDLREDAARNRKDHGAENLSILRKLALNLLRSHPDKASIRRKIKKAGWNDQFLVELIAQMR